MKRTPQNDQLEFCEAFPEYEDEVWHKKKLWETVRIESRYIPRLLLALLCKNERVIKHITVLSQTQCPTAMPINTLMFRMINLTYINFEGSNLLYTLNILHNTPNVMFLNVSNCQNLSTYSMIHNVKYLPDLRVLKCDYNSVHVSAYSIHQTVVDAPSLKYLSCKDSGIMQPWLIKMILQDCPELEEFYFITLFSMDSERQKYSWYEIVRKIYPHVKFGQSIIEKVIEYENSCDRIITELKQKHFWQMLDEWAEDAEY